MKSIAIESFAKQTKVKPSPKRILRRRKKHKLKKLKLLVPMGSPDALGLFAGVTATEYVEKDGILFSGQDCIGSFSGLVGEAVFLLPVFCLVLSA